MIQHVNGDAAHGRHVLGALKKYPDQDYALAARLGYESVTLFLLRLNFRGNPAGFIALLIPYPSTLTQLCIVFVLIG